MRTGAVVMIARQHSDKSVLRQASLHLTEQESRKNVQRAIVRNGGVVRAVGDWPLACSTEGRILRPGDYR